MNISNDCSDFISTLLGKSKLHHNKIESYLHSRDDEFLGQLDQFISQYKGYLSAVNLNLGYSIDAFLKMCDDMMVCQIKFMRTGKYPALSSSHAFEEVYNNKETMLSYMIGLAISQFLWETHYEMFNGLKKSLMENKHLISNYLEIGPGHGLFLKSAIDILGEGSNMIAVDISSTSLEISKSIINYFYPDKHVNFINQDFLELSSDSKFDFIVMGEVIEHVERPELFLNKIATLLGEKGKAFISTCVNCPAIDHVYHFKYVDEIRTMLNSCGLDIVSEQVLPVEKLPMEIVIKKNITINYAVVVMSSVGK
jgi:SAM-dependent methyltransferase